MQPTLQKTAAKGQPAQPGDRLAAVTFLGQIGRINARILQAVARQVVIMVAVNDIAFKRRIRNAGQRLQVLAEGQRELIDIGRLPVVVIPTAGVIGKLAEITQIIVKAMIFQDRSDPQHVAQQPRLWRFEPERDALPLGRWRLHVFGGLQSFRLCANADPQ
ncbi:hypothetical protein D3C72_1382070 [compost metagenome]